MAPMASTGYEREPHSLEGGTCTPDGTNDTVTSSGPSYPSFTRANHPQPARPVHLIITMIKWIRTGRLPIKTSLRAMGTCAPDGTNDTVTSSGPSYPS